MAKKRSFSVPRAWQYVGLAVVGAVVLGLTVAALQPRTPTVTAQDRPALTAEDFATEAPSVPVAVAFGDSWFNGADGIPAEEAFGYLALTQLGFETFVGGHGGTGYAKAEPIEGGAPNYVDQIAAGGFDLGADPNEVDLVVIEGGLNDFDQDAAAVKANALSVIASARASFPNARVILVGPPAIGTDPDQITAVTGAIAAAAAESGVEFIDMGAWVTADNIDQIIGDVSSHPDREGFQALAGMLAPELTALNVSAVS